MTDPTAHLNVEVPVSLRKALRLLAMERDLCLRDFCVEILEAYVANPQRRSVAQK